MPYLSSLISKSLTEMNPVPHRYDLFDMPVLSIIQLSIIPYSGYRIQWEARYCPSRGHCLYVV